MLDITYRNATITDLKSIVSIYNSVIASRMVTADLEPVSIESKMNWFHDHNATNCPLQVIESTENEIIGWVSFQSFYGRAAYDATVEISIYLDVSQRGKGLGKQIIAYCIEKALSFGVKTLLAFIFSHNEPSLKLFHHFGFEDWATLPNIALLDGEEKGLKILGKRIAQIFTEQQI